MSNSILINTVIEWSIEDSESSQLERVLCLNAAADIAVLFSLSDKKALPGKDVLVYTMVFPCPCHKSAICRANILYSPDGGL